MAAVESIPPEARAQIVQRLVSESNGFARVFAGEQSFVKNFIMARQYDVAVRFHRLMGNPNLTLMAYFRMNIDALAKNHSVARAVTELAKGAPAAAAMAFPNGFVQLELGAIALGGAEVVGVAGAYVAATGVASYGYASVANHLFWEPLVTDAYQVSDAVPLPGTDASLQDVINTVTPWHPYGLVFNFLDENGSAMLENIRH